MTKLTGARNSGKKLYEIYEFLLSEFGPQGWWPTIAGRRMAYHPGDYSYPKTEAQRFEIAAGALLAQNTSWKNAEKALMNLHSSRKLSPGAIISTPLPELESLIRPSGYFRQKAGRLKFLSRSYLKADNRMDTESLRSHFLSVKGIGPETADSILLYAYNRPSFVVDAYTRRFCSALRLFHGKSYDDYRKFFQDNLPPEPELYNEFHALIVECGKRHRR
ncbi:MAG: endonuclease III domain-containing protein [Candidatus ainarchaeum sp.]|nr:endonuclease III domain-containing protein [Candidatus ainarchaeum sp.]